MLPIVDYQELSLIDYPGKRSAVVFVKGCNFKCWYCHNSNLIPMPNDTDKPIIQQKHKAFYEYIEKSGDKIESVVITGGEPSIHGLTALIQFIETLHSINPDLLIKLDTNGLLGGFNDNDLIVFLSAHVDYLALDIKGLLNYSYGEYVQDNQWIPATTNIYKLLRLVNDMLNVSENLITLELRTTVDLTSYRNQDYIQLVKDLHESVENYDKMPHVFQVIHIDNKAQLMLTDATINTIRKTKPILIR